MEIINRHAAWRIPMGSLRSLASHLCKLGQGKRGQGVKALPSFAES